MVHVATPPTAYEHSFMIRCETYRGDEERVEKYTEKVVTKLEWHPRSCSKHPMSMGAGGGCTSYEHLIFR